MGFSLIELLVAIVILGILASIAYPTYTEQVRKSRRADAKTALLELSQRQENFYVDNNAYASSLSELLGASSGVVGGFTVSGNTALSKDKHYKIVIETASARSFTMYAEPAETSPQRTDIACARMTINSAGQKSALNSSGDEGSNCW